MKLHCDEYHGAVKALRASKVRNTIILNNGTKNIFNPFNHNFFFFFVKSDSELVKKTENRFVFHYQAIFYTTLIFLYSLDSKNQKTKE